MAPRSSVSFNFIDVGAGVIDADYTGTVRVVIYNFSADAGDRIAQLIIERIFRPSSGTSSTIPGDCGFGSTGK